MATLPVSLSSSGPGPRARPLKVGLVLPTLTGSPPGPTLGWRDHLALAKAAEAAGFDSIWVPDELLYRFDDAPAVGWWECWTMLSAVAASTARVELGTFVSCTNYRNPALLAKMAATVDEISGGRLILGLGAGWSERQFRTFGYPADHLLDRFGEALAVIRGLLREGRVTFEGRHYQAQDAELLPAGPRPGGIPILVGGTSRRVMRLAVRHAQAWNVFLMGGDCSPGRVPPFLAALDEACASTGRDPATLGRSAGVMVALSEEPFRVGKSDWAQGALRGTPAELAEHLRAFARAGIDHLQLGISPPTAGAVEEVGRVLELLDGGS